MKLRAGALTVVKPVPEIGKTMLNQVFGGTEVEPRIEFVDDALESDDREQAGSHSSCCDCDQDNQTQQASGVAACFALEEATANAVCHVACTEVAVKVEADT